VFVCLSIYRNVRRYVCALREIVSECMCMHEKERERQTEKDTFVNIPQEIFRP